MRRLALLVFACCTAHDAVSIDAAFPPDAASSTTDAVALADAAPSTHTLTIIVEPNGNHAQEVVADIAAAQTSIYMTMYELDNTAIVDALVAKAKAGLDVQAVLDAQNQSFNQSAKAKLVAAGANVVWSSSAFTYTHEKCVIIDGAIAWIMTMNATQSAPTANREYLARDTDPADVAEATAIFVADHALHAISPTGALVVANTNARADLVQLIGTATTSLDVEGEEFSDTTGVVAAVVQAAQRGVAVRVIVATGNVDAPSVKSVKTAGGKVVVTAQPYIHAKAIVVDGGARAFVGSENFSAGSLSNNRELGVIFDDPAETAKVAAAIATDFAAGVAQ